MALSGAKLANGVKAKWGTNYIGEVKTISDIGNTASADVEVTHLTSEAKEYLGGLPDYGEITITGNWIPTDLGQTDLQADELTRATDTLSVEMPNHGKKVSGTAYVKAFAINNVGVDQPLQFTCTFKMTGKLTFAALV